ncbi:hypothetical protein HQ590_15365 [bacterium]|nr:hypothetical protein [bacterium]
MKSIPERDWKYLQRICPAMLDALCGLINSKAIEILGNQQLSQHDRYLQLYRHLEVADRVVGECFNDWRRSNIWLTIRLLYHRGVLTTEQVSHLTDETKRLLTDVEPQPLETILEDAVQQRPRWRRRRPPVYGLAG